MLNMAQGFLLKKSTYFIPYYSMLEHCNQGLTNAFTSNSDFGALASLFNAFGGRWREGGSSPLETLAAFQSFQRLL